MLKFVHMAKEITFPANSAVPAEFTDLVRIALQKGSAHVSGKIHIREIVRAARMELNSLREAYEIDEPVLREVLTAAYLYGLNYELDLINAQSLDCTILRAECQKHLVYSLLWLRTANRLRFLETLRSARAEAMWSKKILNGARAVAATVSGLLSLDQQVFYPPLRLDIAGKVDLLCGPVSPSNAILCLQVKSCKKTFTTIDPTDARLSANDKSLMRVMGSKLQGGGPEVPVVPVFCRVSKRHVHDEFPMADEKLIDELMHLLQVITHRASA